MADKSTGKDNESAAEERGIAQGLPVTIHAQYIKDLSFENPNAPGSLQANGERPSMDVNFSMDARKLESAADKKSDLYEIVLGIQAAAMRGSQVDFLVELEYAVLVSAAELPEEQLHPLLLIEIPRQAFPFARQIIADLTQQAGYPPLLLAPVDFRAFYLQRFGKGPGSVKQSAA